MKIAIFDNVPPGGASRVALEQALYLDTRKHQVVWYTTKDPKIKQTPNSIKRISHNLLDKEINQRHILSRSLWLSRQLLQQYQEINRLIEAQQPDVVLVHPCRHTQAPYIMRLTKIPTVYFIEEPLRVVSEPELHSITHLPFHSRLAAKWERILLGRIDKKNTMASTFQITHSQFNANSVKRHYGISAMPIGLGVDTNVFKKTTPTNKKTPYFLFVGDKNELNGHAFLHKAILRKNISLRFVTAQHGTLSLSDQQLAKLYSGATATLCLSRKEPFGLVALESMACSTPVIALSEGGYKETVTSDKTGLLIKRRPQSLATAIETMLDPAFHRSVSRNCRSHVIKNFSWHQHGAKLEQVLERAASIPRPLSK
jgi:glycosyltransferase involved in cell wall biosynthesis